MKVEIREINTKEDDYYLKLDDEMFWMSDRAFNLLVKGLKQGSADQEFRVGESRACNR